MIAKFIAAALLSCMPVFSSLVLHEATAANLKSTSTTELGAKIVLNSRKLDDMGMKLLLLGGREKPIVSKDLLDGIDRIHDFVGEVAVVVRSTGIMMSMVPHIEEQYRMFWAQTVAEELDRASNTVKAVMPELEYYLGDSRYGVLLLTIGDLRGVFKETQQALVEGKENLKTVSHDHEAQ
jgi:hypothetical protein